MDDYASFLAKPAQAFSSYPPMNDASNEGATSLSDFDVLFKESPSTATPAPVFQTFLPSHAPRLPPSADSFAKPSPNMPYPAIVDAIALSTAPESSSVEEDTGPKHRPEPDTTTTENLIEQKMPKAHLAPDMQPLQPALPVGEQDQREFVARDLTPDAEIEDAFIQETSPPEVRLPSKDTQVSAWSNGAYGMALQLEPRANVTVVAAPETQVTATQAKASNTRADGTGADAGEHAVQSLLLSNAIESSPVGPEQVQRPDTPAQPSVSHTRYHQAEISDAEAPTSNTAALVQPRSASPHDTMQGVTNDRAALPQPRQQEGPEAIDAGRPGFAPNDDLTPDATTQTAYRKLVEPVETPVLTALEPSEPSLGDRFSQENSFRMSFIPPEQSETLSPHIQDVKATHDASPARETAPSREPTADTNENTSHPPIGNGNPARIPNPETPIDPFITSVAPATEQAIERVLIPNEKSSQKINDLRELVSQEAPLRSAQSSDLKETTRSQIEGGALSPKEHANTPSLVVPDKQDAPLEFATMAVDQRRSASEVPSVHQAAPARSETPYSIGHQLAASIASQPDRPVELTLSPEELGRVKLTLQSADQAMVVSVQAERQDTIDLMRRHIDSLTKDFREMGFSNVSFSFSQQSHKDQNDAPRTGTKADAATDTPYAQSQSDALSRSPIRITLGPTAQGLDLRI
jgi:flagellar hook-length control protein FliK